MNPPGKLERVWPDRAAYKNLMIRAFEQDRSSPGMSDSAEDSPLPARSWLAGAAEVRGPVHEADPPHRRTAPGARLPLLAVDLQRAVEVAALAVDVHVERVEG